MKEIKLALKTRTRKDAKVITKSYIYRLERIFTLARCGMLTDSQIAELLNEFKHKTLKEMEDDRIQGKGVMTHKEYDDPESYGDYYEYLDESRDILKEALVTNDLKSIESAVDDLLKAKSIALNKDSDQYKKVCREMLKVWVTIYEIEMERVKGNYNNDYDRRLSSVSKAQVSPILSTGNSTTDKLLSEVIEEHLNEKAITGKANALSIESYQESLKLMQAILVDDVPIKSLTIKAFQEIAMTMTKLPKNMNVINEYKGQPINVVLELVKDKPDVKLLSQESCSKHMSRISSLMKWAVKHDYVAKNNAEGLTMKKKKGGEPKRFPFTKDELKKLIESPLYTKTNAQKPHEFFLPLIALFQGMRMNEICQLDVTDIIHKDGYDCIDINDNAPDKKLKTPNARRIVPVHPTLKAIGFLDYVEYMRQQSHRKLWTALKFTKKDNSYKHQYSKDWNNYCDKFIVDAKGKDFHSFRYTIVNELKQKKVDQALVSGIVGHENSIITYSTYGSDYEPKPLYETLLILDNYGFDFSTIKFPVEEFINYTKSKGR